MVGCYGSYSRNSDFTGSEIVSDSSRLDIYIAKTSNKGGKWKRILSLWLYVEILLKKETV